MTAAPVMTVDDTVVAYVSELARHAEVFVCFDGSLQPGQLDRLSGLVAGAWVRRHGAHDFGSWSVLARELVGWDALAAYDEVLLVNDSCWLLRPLDEVFARMDARPGDFWGLQVTARRFEPDHRRGHRRQQDRNGQVPRRHPWGELQAGGRRGSHPCPHRRQRSGCGD